jgi:hypothetical protein
MQVAVAFWTFPFYPFAMTKLEKSEQDVSGLTKKDLKRFSARFNEFRSDLWDAQIAADVENGKLDGLIARAKRQVAGGKVGPPIDLVICGQESV